jgi:hypothetical protein
MQVREQLYLLAATMTPVSIFSRNEPEGDILKSADFRFCSKSARRSPNRSGVEPEFE